MDSVTEDWAQKTNSGRTLMCHESERSHIQELKQCNYHHLHFISDEADTSIKSKMQSAVNSDDTTNSKVYLDYLSICFILLTLIERTFQ